VMEAQIATLLLPTTDKDGDTLLPLGIKVPRRQLIDYHADLFPDVAGSVPEQSASEWLAGGDKAPIHAALDPERRGAWEKSVAEGKGKWAAGAAAAGAAAGAAAAASAPAPAPTPTSTAPPPQPAAAPRAPSPAKPSAPTPAPAAPAARAATPIKPAAPAPQALCAAQGAQGQWSAHGWPPGPAGVWKDDAVRLAGRLARGQGPQRGCAFP
jgi:hypothetical protein